MLRSERHAASAPVLAPLDHSPDFGASGSLGNSSNRLSPLGHGQPPLLRQQSSSLLRQTSNTRGRRQGTRTLDSPARYPAGFKYALRAEEAVSQIAKGQTVVKCPRAHMGDVGVVQIADVLSKLEFGRTLQSLDLTGNLIAAPGIRKLAETLMLPGTAPKLIEICLDNNQLDAEAGRHVANMLESPNCQLKKLVLSRNRLAAAGGRDIAKALENNTKMRELDLSDNSLTVDVGVRLAKSMLTSRVRNLDVSDNGFPREVVASIEAALSFSSHVWAEADLDQALLEACRLCPLKRGNLADLPEYLDAITCYWKNEKTAKDIMASLHAPIAALRYIEFHRGPRPESVEYKHERLQFLARMYAPRAIEAAGGITLPEGHISVRGLFVLNLTPFCITLDGTTLGPLSGIGVPHEGLNAPGVALPGSAGVDIEVTSPTDAPPDLSRVRMTARFAFRVGEHRETLDANGGATHGQLRIMFSVKDYTSVHDHSSSGRRASMLTLVWAPPARLSGVHLGELVEKWELYRTHQLQSRAQLPLEPNMYHAVKSWVKPDAGPPQSSFASLCDFGPVDVFVSHWWGSPLKQTFEALERHGENQERRRIWVCSIANNQWRVAEELGDDIDTSPFRQALACSTCRCTALMLDTDGAPLKRFWCLYEIMTVMRLRQDGRDMPLDLCTPEGVINQGTVRADVGLRLAAMVGKIDVAAAECWHEEDRRMITEAINTHLGGFERMNEQIRLFVLQGLQIMHEGMTDEFYKTMNELRVADPASPKSPEKDPSSPVIFRTLNSQSWGSGSDQVQLLQDALEEKDKEIERLRAENRRLREENQKLRVESRGARAGARWLATRNKAADPRPNSSRAERPNSSRASPRAR